MTLLAKKTGGGSNLGPLAPSGVHQAVCVDVIDLGVLTTEFEGKKSQKHMVQLVWQLDKRDAQTQRRYLVGKRYNLSLNEKATLRKDLESWRTKPFTREEELGGFDIERVKGGNCMVNVQHVTKTTGTYANVITVNPLYHGMTKLHADNYARPAAATEDHDGPDDVDDDPFAQDAPSAAPVGAAATPAPLTDDDIPF